MPLAFANLTGDALLEAIHADGRITLYKGPAVPLWLDTTRLAAGDYRIELNGTPVLARLTLTSPIRTSPASMQDEATPPTPPNGTNAAAHWENVHKTFAESGLSSSVAVGGAAAGREHVLDVMARSGAMMLVNPDTRPISFCPTSLMPTELDGMSQRMLLTAQANGRYPNFGGFCYGWDPTGYAVNGRKMLMTYWGWNDKTPLLRDYIAKSDKFKTDEFTRRTGFPAVTEAELIAYLLSIKRPEFAPVIDLPTLRWVEQIAQYTKPMDDAQRKAFEARLDAWSSYLMNTYAEVYGTFSKNLREMDPALRNSASIQVDHCMVRVGQYFPSGYGALDFRYQSTWNDQVGGPDYAYQPLLTQALLAMGRTDQPTWISNALASAHHRANYPGKFMRNAAQGLAYGATGQGFACEAFSNLLGGMNKDTNWGNIKGKSGGADLESGRDFLQRFAPLALAGKGAHGVGILFSKSQFARSASIMGFGEPHYKTLVILTRLGYTPCFITEEDLAAGNTQGIKALLVTGQTVPLAADAQAAIAKFGTAGGLVIVDDNTTAEVPTAKKLGYAFSFIVPGKPHSWSAPNMIEGDNDTLMMARWEKELGPIFEKALGDTGRAIYKTKTAGRPVSVMQIAGGKDANYLVAINDSHIQTQADWYQVRETLVPTTAPSLIAEAYDCTDEKSLGKAGEIECDLTATTARVYAVLARPLGATVLAATQKLRAGEPINASVSFNDAAGKPLAAALPFALTLVRPDGTAAQTLYRSTTAAGRFTITLPTAANAPVGNWKLEARSLLNGQVSSLPLTLSAAKTDAPATVLKDNVVVRDAAGIARALGKNTQLVLPIFDSPSAPALLEVAQKIKSKLAKSGATVDIREKPAMGVFTVAYGFTPEQEAANAKVDAGEVIGKIKVETLNGNDWESYISGYRFGRSVILLDLAGVKDNPLAEQLNTLGATWPRVDSSYPGAGKAVVQVVRWAFGPRVDAVVIQASDIAGLEAGAAALLDLPQDRLTPSVQGIRKALWQQHNVGSAPAQPDVEDLSSKGLTTRSEPKPLVMQFPDAKPPAANAVVAPAPVVRKPTPLPAAFDLKGWTIQLRDGDRFIDSATVDFLKPDLRFSDALKLDVVVQSAGPTKIAVTGLFRYSDRKPCWQAQWEDIIDLREKLMPKERQPMAINVFVDGKAAGTLKPTLTEERTVKLELASPSAGMQPRTAVEEVVVELSGEVTLPEGTHSIILAHVNMIDGNIHAIGVGVQPQAMPAPVAPKAK